GAASPAASATASASASLSATPVPSASANDIHNEGQKILATLATPLAWFVGEGSSSPGTQVQNYRLSGTSLAGSALHCTKFLATATNNGCAALVILPSLRLENGTSYDLTLLDQPLGSFTVDGLVQTVPHVLTAKATQYDLTVTFDRPMLHAGDCGGTS